MGIDKNRFVNLSIDSSLVCGLCAQILSQPVFCKGCACFICKMCSEMFTCEHPEEYHPQQIDDSFSEEVSFQDDHAILPLRQYSSIQKQQMKAYQSLKAKCIHPGCIRVETLKHLDAHQKGCKYSSDNIDAMNKKYCPESCEFDNDIQQHIHVKTCMLYPKKCNTCGQSAIYMKDFEEHSCIKYLLELKNLLETKNTICQEEALLLDQDEIQITEKFETDNNNAMNRYKQLSKENKGIRADISTIQTQFQKEMAKLESSVIPRMRIFQENSQERVICFENRQADSLSEFSKQLLYFRGALTKDMNKEVVAYQQGLQDTKKGILKAEEKRKLRGVSTPSIKENFMMSTTKRMKF